mmetsp:Transcript_22212/g.62235  ORF Transcript_22212/g.62235 Transcript_22212/m.62235 type:complete len:321 (-) Transcript_22212:77-1039(-)|eukprot:CAMPEP_0177202348 /NCGR_PEP_ID=MMETSP0367-20130122/27244_1 /TAXON_ID=447022 ORGANISM="Scrippsiella hangoei-like, Strain SHHI-4" /NCGR_SAMPLE_ID=MMETSP0367 /ASSEMBLY_ACC=CAM_ASM_000362 /LENGTH=320 /DNA_ID=CAMNT_0018650927 /DNA_START=55 /DNA_END=1017 /DNA_ORIENTATION=+
MPSRLIGALSSAFRGGRPRVMRLLLLACLLASLVSPALAAYGKGKKSKFMSAYPILFKFVLFWWCVFVFVVMGFYVADNLMWRKFGPAKVAWSVERTFKAAPDGGRAAFWAQLVDPTKWSMSHPVLQSADIRMVECTKPEAEKNDTGSKDETSKESAGDKAAAEAAEPAEPAKSPNATEADEGLVAPSAALRPVELRPLEAGLGFILRHKQSLGGPRAGSFFCARECTKLETPADGTWRMFMRTVEVGNGYPFEPDSEESEVELAPPAEDGSVRCTINGFAAVNSRLFRWWNGLEPNSRAGSEAMLEAIENEVLSAKKNE